MEADLKIPWTAANWSPLDVIEESIGCELTPATADMVRYWPVEIRVALTERLASSVIGALAFDPEPAPFELDNLSFGSVDREWRAEGGTYALPNLEIRQQLLYLNRICVADHFSRYLVNMPPFHAAQDWESFELFGQPQTARLFDGWLTSMGELAPALRDGSVQLVIPCDSSQALHVLFKADTSSHSIKETLAAACLAYAADISAAPDARNAFELTAGAAFYKVDVHDPAAFYRRMASIIAEKSNEEIWEAARTNSLLARKSAAATQDAGKPVRWDDAVCMAMRGLFGCTHSLLLPALASNLALGIQSTSGAGSSTACMKLFGLKTAESTLSKKRADVSQLLSRFRLPNPGTASLDLLLSLRKNEAVFKDLQRAVGDVVGQVSTCNPESQRQFELELEQALDDLLSPKIGALQKSTRSSFFEKALLPGGLAMSAGAVVLAATQQFPATALAGAALAPASYLADRLYKRYKKSGRVDHQVVEALVTFRDIGLQK